MNLEFRRARISECGQIAELTSMASDGAVDFLFHDLLPGLSPVEVVAQGLKQDGDAFSCRNCLVAADKDVVAGMVMAYSSEYFTITEEMAEFIPAPRLEHFADFFAAGVENSLYIDTLCVRPAYRRQGIASTFMHMLADDARRFGLTSLSLIVFAENTPARAFYKTCGFKTLRAVSLEPAEYIRHTKGCVLMVGELDEVD